MKNHILNSIFEAANEPLTKEGVAAIKQLLTEAASKHPGVEPFGFSYHQVPTMGETNPTFYLHAKLSDPWPMDSKIFCGKGLTVELAFADLETQLTAWFTPNGMPADLRTEYAA